MTFDIEEWFHILENGPTDSEDSWKSFEVRIHSNVDRILDILDESGSKATFFIIGWIARNYPEVVRKIAARYEVASHTDGHRLVSGCTPDAFREDIRRSVATLEDITGQKVRIFRAPGFSIGENELWAFDILAGEGIETDCSVFPKKHAHGGMPSFPSHTPCIISHGGISLKEFPMPTVRALGRDIVFSGGGYFRMWPYPLLRKWTENVPDDYLLSYIHPRDLDKGQPVIPGISLKRRIKSRWGIASAEAKLRRYMKEFSFTDIRDAEDSIDWSSVQNVRL